MKTDAEVATFLDRLTMALEIAVGTIRAIRISVSDEVLQIPIKAPSVPLEPEPEREPEFKNPAPMLKTLPTEDQCDECAGSGVYRDNGVPQACNCIEALKTTEVETEEEGADEDEDADTDGDAELENVQAAVKVKRAVAKKQLKRPKLDMQCRQITDGARCLNKSRGPRYRFMCSDHEELGRPQCTWIGKGAVRCPEKACSPGALCVAHRALEDRAQQGLFGSQLRDE